MDVGEIGFGGVNLIGLAKGMDKWKTIVHVVMNLPVPQNAGNFSGDCISGALSSSAELQTVSFAT
jgi:hypothetical protein